jgi:ABC-type transport system involved in cytochrome c biogenesis permease subunit
MSPLVFPLATTPLATVFQWVLVSAVVCNVLACALMLARWRRMGALAFAAGWALPMGLFLALWKQLGEPPFGNMYHVLVVIGASFAPAYLVLRWKDGLRWPAPAFALMAAIPLIGALMMEHDGNWSRMPALQSPWFVPHVAAYTFGYCLAGTAFALTLAGAVRQGCARMRWPLAGSADPFNDAAHTTLRLAFPLITFGLCSGALWAEEVWGSYWGWDAKETWSLITWILYAMALHCHTRKSLSKWCPWLQLLGFLAILMTLLGVNYIPKLSSLLHGYA